MKTVCTSNRVMKASSGGIPKHYTKVPMCTQLVMFQKAKSPVVCT